jgi:hypothetical protein
MTTKSDRQDGDGLEYALGTLRTIAASAHDTSAKQMAAIAQAGIDLATQGPIESGSERGDGPARDAAEGADLYFEPSGDGMAACIHHANGAIICEAKYDDFGNDPSEPERIMKQLVEAGRSNTVSSDALRDKIYEILQKEVAANKSGFVVYGKAVSEIASLFVAAPPKPAPDAMREATRAQHVGLPKGEPAKFVRNGKLETCQCNDCRALSPSGTGAAEPVAWGRPHVEYSASRGQSRVEFWVSREDGKKIAAGLATPPVRGDREAIKRAICCPQGCQYEGDSEDGSKCYCDTSDYNGSGVEKRFNAVLVALSLPVQSGADDEREWFDIDSAPENQTVEVRAIWGVGDGDIGEDIKFTHWRPLSRQAPHSGDGEGR